jgi:hypothetical protein
VKRKHISYLGDLTVMRITYVVVFVVVLAAWLLPVGMAFCETPAANDVQWDNVGPAENSLGEVAMMGPEDGPPDGMHGPRSDLIGPPPGGSGMGAQPPRPPHDGDRDRRPPPENRRGPGMPGMGGMPGGPMPPNMDMPGGPRGPMGMMPNDPEMRELLMKDGQLEHDAYRLAGQYRQATGEAREKIKKEVEETVTKQFEVRQQRRNLELKHLEEQLKDLREAVEKREKARKELIEKRVSKLLGTDKELEF